VSRRSFESPEAEEKRGAVKRARAARKTNGAPEVRDPCGPRKAKGASREAARKGRRGQFAGRAMAPQGSLDEYLREISAYPLIDRAEEAALARRIARGDREALCKLVNSNLRFVVSIAKKYQNQGVALADLISEGNLGLIRAAEKFDETKGVKFISYAVWWIRQAILQALAEQSRIVRVPLNRAGELHRLGKRSNALVQELGREPTIKELAHGLDVPEEEIHRTLSIAAAHLSLDAPLAPGEDNKLLDYLADDQRAGPDQEVEERALRENVAKALGSLKDREQQILKMYYGLGGDEPMTLEQIGQRLGVTRERVRQIKERALTRLRHVERARSLESFRE
jgi:RNA polymerase primary sigma factor